MLNKICFANLWKCSALIYIVLFITSCYPDDTPDISDIAVTVNVDRFEQDLFSINPADIPGGLNLMQNKYGNFLNLFLFRVTGIGSKDTALMNDRLKGFLTDTNFVAIFRDSEKMYASFGNKEKEFTEAFRYYRYYFPEKYIPRVLTIISGFAYSVVNDSSNLAVSLDMYLGPEYYYYSTIEPVLPAYLRSRMDESYMVNDAMKGWVMSDYGIDETTARMVDFMISQGRTIYLLDKILPDIHDSIKTGYTGRQLEWCYQNERKIWSFFIENKLLFSSDPNLMNKYVNDGPTTNGFPKESPGNIGQFIGWQIVRSYMKNHPGVSVQQLMEEKEMIKIFNESKYKPAK